MSFKIIRYDSQYEDAVVDLWRKCDLIVPQNDPREDIRRKYDFQPSLFFVALQDGKLVGSVMAGYEGHRGWINYLAVLPECRRRGYGRKLMEKAVEELTKMDCPKINLQVRDTNLSVVDFYRHLGFKDDHVVSLGKRLTT